jgi:conjugal transfer/type IV secretion protein DotA/TraY
LGGGSGLTNDGYVKAVFENAINAQAIAADGAVAKLYADLWPIANFASHPWIFASDHKKVANEPESEEAEKWALQYWRAIDAFQLRMNSYADAAADNGVVAEINESFVSLVEQNGMMLGGAYYYLISRRQAAMSQAIEDAFPSFETIEVDRLRHAPWYANFWGRVASWFNGSSSNERTDPMMEAVSVADSVITAAFRVSPDVSFALARANEKASKDTGAGNLIGAVGQQIAEWGTGVSRIGENTSMANPDPILEMQSLGVKIQQAIVVGAGLSAVAGKTPLGKSGKLFKQAAGMAGSAGGLVVSLMVGGLLVVAFLYSTIIPMLPLIMFSISAMGLFLLLIKALIAAPFWWAMHAHPSGEDLVGRAGQGWGLLLTLALSPVLMVFGLVAAIALTRLSGWFVNVTMMPSIGLMNDGFTSPTGWVAYFVGYGLIMGILVYKNFGLIYELRQVVLKWMGVDDSYTDFGEKEGETKAVGLAMYAQSVGKKMEKN